MEKHTCKLCFRSFANGRALGGHMRSHVAATTKAAAAAAAASAAAAQVHKYTPPSASLSSSTSSREEDDDHDEEEGDHEIGIGYGLRENPRKSFRLVDPEFFAVDAAAAGSSVVVQDRESETESSRAPLQIHHRRRSKRARPYPITVSVPDTPEPEPVSSVSDNTPEEDVANWLMMLSRDTWKNKKKNSFQHEYDVDQEYEDEYDDEDDDDDEDEENERMMMMTIQQQKQKEKQKQAVVVKGRSKYQCGTCKKVFRSYQALGGHRASHKKFNSCFPPPSPSAANGIQIRNADKIVQHECPVCFRIFSSGQALGGHKRSHLTPSTATITITNSSTNSLPLPPRPHPVVSKFGDSLIDLNLPAPMEDDAELSAVSDAEFVLHRSN